MDHVKRQSPETPSRLESAAPVLIPYEEVTLAFNSWSTISTFCLGGKGRKTGWVVKSSPKQASVPASVPPGFCEDWTGPATLSTQDVTKAQAKNSLQSLIGTLHYSSATLNPHVG